MRWQGSHGYFECRTWLEEETVSIPLSKIVPTYGEAHLPFTHQGFILASVLKETAVTSLAHSRFDI